MSLQCHFNINFNITSITTSTQLQFNFNGDEVAVRPFPAANNTHPAHLPECFGDIHLIASPRTSLTIFLFRNTIVV
jgi:hypothetical protein